MGNLIQRTTEFAMHIVSAYVRPGDIVIDATCGNGHDTLRLARMKAGHVYAFDLQPEAADATRRLLAEHGYDRITVTCLPHEQMLPFFSERSGGSSGFAAAILFNLGYLPGGDKTLTTKAETTMKAVRDAMTLLREDGLLCITMYSGHPEGAAEKKALLAFAEGLDPKAWHVSYVSMHNQKKDPPEILLISRKR